MAADLRQEVLDAFACRRCVASGFQCGPLLYAGRPYAPILVVGQNPGQIDREKYPDRAWWIDHLHSPHTEISANLLTSFYEYDFGTSLMARQLGAVLGGDWLETGNFWYTNAVLCRTPRNEAPSEEMQENCKAWTISLVKRSKLIVLVGAIARAQLFGKSARLVKFGDTVKLKGKEQWVFSMSHPSSWRHSKGDTAAEFRAGFATALAQSGITL